MLQFMIGFVAGLAVGWVFTRIATEDREDDGIDRDDDENEWK